MRLCRFLIKFCALVEKHEDVNKMSAGNLAVVISPNLLWAYTDDMRWVKTLASSALIDRKIISEKYFLLIFGHGSAVTTFKELKRLGGRHG